MTVAPDALIGARYRAVDRLADGGMGEIWCGEDTLLQRQVVIKVLRADFATDPEFRERFRAEARHAAVLTQPNVTQVFDLVEDDGGAPPCIVMEYVAGDSLETLLDRDGPLDADKTWSILGQTAAALAAAHRIGIVHRDIKPANILVCPNGLVKVTDFGIARAPDEAVRTQPGILLGSVHYLSPEQLSGDAATTASDMYALGAVAYQCLTGRPPFDGDLDAVARAHQRGERPSLPDDVPRGLAELVLALLAENPDDRPSDPDAIARQAERLTRERALDAYPAEPAVTVAGSPVGGMTRVLSEDRRSRTQDLWRVTRAHPTALAVCLLVAAIVAAGVLANALLTNGPSPRHRAASTPDGSSAAKSVAVQSASVVGGSDHPEELHNITDSSTSSAWYTEHYATAAFGGLKSGVGLRLEVSPSAAVKSVVINFANPGVAVKLYAGDSLSSLQGAKALGATSSAPGEWRLTLPRPVHAQTWLIWISRLAADSGGYRAGVGDVRLLS